MAKKKLDPAYYVAQDEATNEFLTYDKKTETIGWTTDEEGEAAWDHTQGDVEQFINRFPGLPTTVKPKPGTGLNHPPRPPMTAM